MRTLADKNEPFSVTLTDEQRQHLEAIYGRNFIASTEAQKSILIAAMHRFDRMELALYRIAGHGNITGEKAREIAAEALGIAKPD